MAIHERVETFVRHPKGLDIHRSVQVLKDRTPRLFLAGLAGVGLLGAGAILFANSRGENEAISPSPLAQSLPTDLPTSFSSNLLATDPYTNTPDSTRTPFQTATEPPTKRATSPTTPTYLEKSSTPQPTITDSFGVTWTLTPDGTYTRTSEPVPISTNVRATDTPAVKPTRNIGETKSNAEIGVLHNFRGEVEGITFPFNLGLGKDIMQRPDRPFVQIGLNTAHWDSKYGPGTAANRVAKGISIAHHLAYQEEHPDVTYEQFLTKLKNGEDVTYTVAASVEGSILKRKEVKVDPRKPVSLILTNEYGGFTVRPKSAEYPGASVKITQDTDGALVLSSFFPSFHLEEHHDAKNAPVVSGSAVSEFTIALNVLHYPIEFQNGSKSESQKVAFDNAHPEKYFPIRDNFSSKGEKPLITVVEP